MPDHPFLEAVLQGCHLGQGHALAILGRHRQARQQRQLGAFLAGAPQQDLDQLVVFPVLADGGTDQRTLEEFRQVGGAHSQGPGPVLVDVQVDHLAGLFPIQVHVDHMGVLSHLGRYLARQGADFLDVLAGDPELHRVAHGRPVLQARDPRAQRRELRR